MILFKIMIKDSTHAISRFATLFLSGTFLSRISGMLRDVAMAFAFGTSPKIAAFMVAYRFAHLMRRIFGEGPITGSFIPHYEKFRQEGPQEGSRFFLEFFFSLALVLILIIGLGEVLLGGCLHLFSGVDPEIVKLTMIMLPGLLFICLYGLTSSFLQCQKMYFLPAVAPVGFNVIWLLGVALAFKHSSSILLLSFAIILGFAFQLVILLPKATSHLTLNTSFRPFSKRVRKMITPFFLGVIGIAAMQINAAIDALFARFASLEGPAYLWYAIRIQQLPVAFFGVAFASALLPSLSRSFEDKGHFLSLMRFSFSRCMTFCLPIMCGIFVLGFSGINLLYGRGGFDESSTAHTTLCLWAYAIGLIPSIITLLFVSAFQAIKDYKTPMVITVWTVLINIILNSIMIFYLHLGAVSVALATSFSSLFQCLYLYSRFSKKIGAPFEKEMLIKFAKVFFIALFAMGVTFVFGGYFLKDPSLLLIKGDFTFTYARHFPSQVMLFFSQAFLFIVICFLGGYIFKIEEVEVLLKRIYQSRSE